LGSSLPRSPLSTVGRRAFPVAGACIWNDLPLNITSPFTGIILLLIFRNMAGDTDMS